METIILIAGSFTSANVNVMLSIIRAIHDKPNIHIVARKYFENEIFPSEEDILCHPVSSIRWKITQSLVYSKRFKFFCHIINALQYRVFRILDNYLPTSLEKNIFKECCSIVDNNNAVKVFSVSDPFFTHRVAEKLSRNKYIKWVPVWLDSYSNGFCKQNKLWELSSLYYEKRIFDKAPFIYSLNQSFVGNRLIHNYENKLKYFDIPYIREIEINCKNKNIIYAGLLGDANRNPIPVLKFFMKAIPLLDKDVCFHFYVRNPDEYKDYQENSFNRILFHPFVSRVELTRILSESYMLISIGNAISFQLPSKVIENISYRKPIIFLYSQKKDPSFNYYKFYPDIFQQDINNVLDDDVEKFMRFINMNHHPISYSKLMSIEVYRKCTPSAVRMLFESD